MKRKTEYNEEKEGVKCKMTIFNTFYLTHQYLNPHKFIEYCIGHL